jgi:hypothetical protein
MTTKKLLLLLLILPLVFTIQSCGNGAGSGYTPPGSGPGDPVYIKLKPARYIAQTNGCIDFYAEVHDAQGELLANIPVTFTNLAEPLGVILDRCGGVEIHTPVNTDSWGRAKITLMSTTPGFATVIAQTTVGAQPRDRKTVLFSACDSYACLVLAPSVQLDVDSVPGDGIYNQPADFIIFEPPPDPDNTVELLATVRNPYGVLLRDAALIWGSDHAEAVFTRTESFTNENGQAVGIVKVTPQSIRDTDTHVTVWAYYVDNPVFPLQAYAYNVVTLFLRPVVIDAITVTADPSVLEPAGTSTITATVTLNTGDPVPDGVTVLFSSCLCEDPPDCTICTDPCGFVDPFSQTMSGLATADFTAPPTTDVICRVTATANGVSGFTDVNVRSADILILPPTITVVSDPAGSAEDFTISGAAPPYIITSSNPAVAFDTAVGDGRWDVVASGDTFTVNIAPDACPGTITLTAYDSLGTSATATITITAVPLDVVPSSAAICEEAASCGLPDGDNIDLTITGGAGPYDVTSSNLVVISNSPAPIPGPTYNVNANDGTVADDDTVSVTLTITDACGTKKTSIIDVFGNHP